MSQPHLSDDRLIEICFDLEVTSSDRAHLQVCPACEERRSNLAGSLDEIDMAATQEADEAFPADRLARLVGGGDGLSRAPSGTTSTRASR